MSTARRPSRVETFLRAIGLRISFSSETSRRWMRGPLWKNGARAARMLRVRDAFEVRRSQRTGRLIDPYSAAF